MTKSNGGFDWGDSVDTKETPRVMLPEGPAEFTVLDMKRSRGECGKYGTQNVALLKLFVVAEDGTEAELEEKIWLVTNLKWKLLQFFTSIGQRKHGDEGDFIPDWSTVKGAGGRCEINHRTYEKRDNTQGVAHNIKAFLDPVEQSEEAGIDGVPF